MPFADLREYLNALEKAGELARVKKEVDPKLELGAICKTMHKKGRKALLFDRVRGSSMPVVTELLATFNRIAMALETDESDLFKEVMSGPNPRWSLRSSRPVRAKKSSGRETKSISRSYRGLPGTKPRKPHISRPAWLW